MFVVEPGVLARVRCDPEPSFGVSSHAVMAGADGRIADLNRS
jgi:hypothetical protein